MKFSYDELYNKAQDAIARPVHVANPSPLYNKTTIAENGYHDVSSFAEAKIDVKDGGGGGGISNPVLTINCINASNPTVFDVYIIEDGILKCVTDVVDPDETKAVETLTICNEDGDWSAYQYYFGESGQGTVSNLSNCTVDSAKVATIIDPTKPASLTFTLLD